MTTEFTGTVAQCLDRLRKLPLGNIAKFIDFTDAHQTTAWGWLMGHKPPAGEFWLRAVCFFNLNGWHVTELETIDEAAKALAELWGYGVLPPEEIRAELKYQTKNNDGLQQIVYGNVRFGDLRLELMHDLARRYEEALAARKVELLDDFALEYDDESSPTMPEHGDRVAQLAVLLQQDVIPLVVWLFSDEATDAQRAQLLRLVGVEEFAEFAVLLNGLKSPRIRQQVRDGRTR